MCHPFLDITSKELRLRKDVEHVLLKFGIDKSQLCFQENIEQFATDAKLIFVDHNNVQNKQLARYDVIQLIDHHEDEKLFLNAEPRIIEVTGSCASLVFNYWYQLIANSSKKNELNEIFKPVAQLILSPILMDTSNLTQKVEKHDIKAVETIMNFVDLDTQLYFQEIHDEKVNITGLSVYELLLKDYKVLNLDDVSVGFSTLAKPLDYVLQHNSQHGLFQIDTEKYLRDHKLDALIMMTSFVIGEEFHREFAIFIPHARKIESVLPSLERELELAPRDPIFEGLHTYNQLKTSASRKQVFPLVKSLLS